MKFRVGRNSLERKACLVAEGGEGRGIQHMEWRRRGEIKRKKKRRGNAKKEEPKVLGWGGSLVPHPFSFL